MISAARQSAMPHESIPPSGRAGLPTCWSNPRRKGNWLKFYDVQCAGLQPVILGNGSNVLVADEGIRGVVLCLVPGLHLLHEQDGMITCGAGVSMNRLCRFALEKGLTGLEFAFGIPGSAGGAAFMNAGAYGGEMKDVLTGCTHLTQSGEARQALWGGAGAWIPAQRIPGKWIFDYLSASTLGSWRQDRDPGPHGGFDRPP